MKTNKLSFARKLKVLLVFYSFLIFIFILIAESYLSIFNPQEYIYPRKIYSAEYGTINPPNTKFEHFLHPETRYYSTNKHGLRGDYIEISDFYSVPNIVLLGDSYTFGIGVNDGFEFSSVLAKSVSQNYNIINTGVGGWGLTQQIRRYYSFAHKFKPKKVFLLFCGNDPIDNINFPVINIIDGKFNFIDLNNADSNFRKKMNDLLANSFILKSNLYMVVSRKIYPRIINLFRKKVDEKSLNDDTLKIQENYNELINLFAKDLNSQGIEFYITSVNSINKDSIKSYQIDAYPIIKNNILKLEKNKLIDFVEINDWYTKDDFKRSPVEHYDIRWNFILGGKLGNYLLDNKNSYLNY